MDIKDRGHLEDSSESEVKQDNYNLHKKTERNIDCLDYMTISESGYFMLIWSPVESIVCLISSYYYAYLAAFSELEPSEIQWLAVWFEVFFLVCLIMNFFKEYTPDGET